MKTTMLAGIICSALAFMGLSATHVGAAEKVSWTMITPFPQADVTAQRFVEFSKVLEKETDGRFTLNVLVAGQHPYQYRDGLRIVTDDLAEISHTGFTYLSSVESWFALPLIPFAVPFAKQDEFTKRWHEEIGNPHLAQKYGLKVLAYFKDSGGWGNAIHTPVPLENFDSLKGLKIRAHDKNTAHLAQVLGAVPATVPYSELYVAVQRKAIDGVMTSLQGAYGQKLWELLKYTNLYEPYFGVDEIVVSQEKWDSLPADLQETVGRLFTEWFSMGPMYAYHSLKNEEILAEAKEKYGANISTISDEFAAELRKRSAVLLENYAEQGGKPAQMSLKLLNEIVAN